MYGVYSIIDEVAHWYALENNESPLEQIARKGLAEYARNKPVPTSARRPGGAA